MSNIIYSAEGLPIDKTLQNIINYSDELMVKAIEYRTVFKKSYPNLDAFRTIENNFYLTKKLLHFLGKDWINRRKGVEKLNHGDCEQINRILTLFFIHCFSVIEYNSKELIKRSENELFHELKMIIITGKNEKGKNEYVYLTKIMKKSQNKIITKHDRKLWESLIKIRNGAVHNNAYFLKGDEINYQLNNREVSIEIKPMDFLRGEFNIILELLEILMTLYYCWVKEFLKLG